MHAYPPYLLEKAWIIFSPRNAQIFIETLDSWSILDTQSLSLGLNWFSIAKSTNKCSVFIWPDLSADHSLLLHILLLCSQGIPFLGVSSNARGSFFSPLPVHSLFSSLLTLEGSSPQVLVPSHSIFILLVISLLITTTSIISPLWYFLLNSVSNCLLETESTDNFLNIY